MDSPLHSIDKSLLSPLNTPRLFFLYLLMICLFLLCAPSTLAAEKNTPQKKLKKVTLHLKWRHQFQFAGYYAAQAQGYYRDQGLEVEILEGGLNRNPVKSVLSGQSQFGVANSELILQRAQGKPVVVLAAIFQHSPLVLIARRENKIFSPQDLVGKRVKMTASPRDVELQAIFVNEGIGLDQIEIIDGPTKKSNFFDESLAAVSAYQTNETFWLKNRGIDYTIINPNTYGIDFYGDCLFTTESLIKDDPLLVKGFLEASLKGWQYAMQRPEELIDYIQKNYPGRKTREHLAYEARAMQKLVLPNLVELGHMNPGRWRYIAETFARFKWMPKKFDLSGFIYDPKIQPNDAWLRWTALITFVGFCLIGLVSIFLYKFNQRLHKEIDQKNKAEKSRLKQVHYLSALEKVDNVIRNTIDLEEAQRELLICIFEIFKPDRTWLVHPCDPRHGYWRVQEEYSSPDHPMPPSHKKDIPTTFEIREVFKAALSSEQPILYGPHPYAALPRMFLESNIKSEMHIAIQTKLGLPWLFGLDQCSYERIWTLDEQKLFKAISLRISTALSNLLFFRHLQLAEERFRALSENVPDLIYILDPQGVFTYVNPAWRNMLGFVPVEILGRKFEAFAAVNSLEICREIFDQVLHQKQTITEKNLELTAKNGQTRRFSVSAAPNFDSHKRIIGMVGICTDMTEQDKLEHQLRQSQKMEAVGTLAGGIAHDFNNLIQAISGFAQLSIKDPQLPATLKENLYEIESATIRASELVKHLLTYSRKHRPDLDMVDLNQVVRNAVKILERTIPKMVQIKLNLAEGLPHAQGDPTQLEQVIMNLGSNANDAMPEGGVLEIKTRLAASSESDDKKEITAQNEVLIINIQDNGCGMDQNTRDQIFDPFFTTKPIGKGTGLGLSVVYGIIKNHKGRIQCQSVLGKGTTFTIELPVAELITKKAAVHLKAEPQPPIGHEKILVVDDEKNITKVAGQILSESGYEVITASSGEEALSCHEKEKGAIDLVMLDLGMPGMGGKKCLEELIKKEPGLKVIIASGYAADEHAKDTQEKGAAGYIKKPYRFAHLLALIREVLDLDAKKKIG
jgi:PAS domain S-box-containing protein